MDKIIISDKDFNDLMEITKDFYESEPITIPKKRKFSWIQKK